LFFSINYKECRTWITIAVFHCKCREGPRQYNY